MIAIGAPAPPLRLPDTDGRIVDASGLDGGALLVFLPAAFTPVCSAELAGLVDLAASVDARGVQVLGIGCDSMFVLRSWADGAGASGGALQLLSDFWPHGEVARRYEAFDPERGIATRTSYLLADGVVRWAAHSPPGVARDMRTHRDAVENHLAEVA